MVNILRLGAYVEEKLLRSSLRKNRKRKRDYPEMDFLATTPSSFTCFCRLMLPGCLACMREAAITELKPLAHQAYFTQWVTIATGS